MEKILNKYFLSVFKQESIQEVLECDQIFREGDAVRLIDVEITILILK